MLFIHGGGFVAGSKDATVHDGTAFAASGAVCVAINYRMGIDGFLPVPGTPTNLGLRDILFALAWVQRNVSAFGGDRANVTVFGESAGAMAIADRSEEHTSELQSLMRISYAVFCLKKKTRTYVYPITNN